MDKVTCTLQQEHPFVGSKEISIYGPDQISNAVAAVKRLPMLVIDNFNEPTETNKGFVKRLLNEAAERGVFVFIMTTEPIWATTLVLLNGGNHSHRTVRSW
jgi:stalled ribosome rescue protein Dom34